MIYKISVKLIDQLLQVAGKSFEEKQEVYIYGLECFLADTLQIFWLLFIGFFMNQMLSTFLFAISFALIKKNIGGAHAKTHFRCILTFSTLTILSNGFIYFFPIECYSSIIFFSSLFSCILICLLAPITHPNHPKSKESQCISRSRCLMIIRFFLPVMLMGGLWNPFLFLPLSLGALAASLTLLFAKGGETKWK